MKSKYIFLICFILILISFSSVLADLPEDLTTASSGIPIPLTTSSSTTSSISSSTSSSTTSSSSSSTTSSSSSSPSTSITANPTSTTTNSTTGQEIPNEQTSNSNSTEITANTSTKDPSTRTDSAPTHLEDEEDPYNDSSIFNGTIVVYIIGGGCVIFVCVVLFKRFKSGRVQSQTQTSAEYVALQMKD